MHRFLRAAGFPDFMTEKTVYDFLEREVTVPANFYSEINTDAETRISEYRLMLTENIGVAAALMRAGNRPPVLQYYYPFFETFEETSVAPCTIERHTAEETFSGLIEDYSPGISLIFFMINSLDYRRKLCGGADPLKAYTGTYLAAFANDGKVLFPIAKKEQDVIADIEARKERRRLQEAALAGDEDAGLKLDNEQVYLFDQINERMHSEDLYTVVDQTFIPWGVECDQYSVVGEITAVEETVNGYSGIPLWLLSVESNDVKFRVCMRKQDLLGEPVPGRRIKCGIWLHGHVNLET